MILTTTKIRRDDGYTALYRFTALQNGLIRIEDLNANLSGCVNADGTYRHGDVRLPDYTVADVLHRAGWAA